MEFGRRISVGRPVKRNGPGGPSFRGRRVRSSDIVAAMSLVISRDGSYARYVGGLRRIRRRTARRTTERARSYVIMSDRRARSFRPVRSLAKIRPRELAQFRHASRISRGDPPDVSLPREIDDDRIPGQLPADDRRPSRRNLTSIPRSAGGFPVHVIMSLPLARFLFSFSRKSTTSLPPTPLPRHLALVTASRGAPINASPSSARSYPRTRVLSCPRPTYRDL